MIYSYGINFKEWKLICQESLKCNCHLAPGKVSLVWLSCTWVTSLATRLQVAATSTHLPLPRGSCALHCLLSALIKLSVCACLDFSLSLSLSPFLYLSLSLLAHSYSVFVSCPSVACVKFRPCCTNWCCMPLTCVVATVELPLLRWWHVSEKSCDFLRRAQLRWADERQAWGVADSVTGGWGWRWWSPDAEGTTDPTCFAVARQSIPPRAHTINPINGSSLAAPIKISWNMLTTKRYDSSYAILQDTLLPPFCATFTRRTVCCRIKLLPV